MKSATTHRADLAKALAIAARATEAGGRIPILRQIRVDVTPSLMTISSTNLDMSFCAKLSIEQEGGEPFSVLIPAKVLVAFVKASKMPTVTISVDGDIATIEDGEAKARIRTLETADDFPVVSYKLLSLIAEINSDALHEILHVTAGSVSTEETRYYLNGICLHQSKSGGLVAVSTDGHRLTKLEDDAIAWGLAEKIILPKMVVDFLLKAIDKKSSEKLSVYHDRERVLRVAGKDWSLTAKLIVGTYPDYTRVLPSFDNRIFDCVINKSTVARIFAGRSPSYVSPSVTIHPDAKTIRCIVPGSHEVSAPINGKGQAVTVNLKYLRDLFRAADQVHIIGNQHARDPRLVLVEDPRVIHVLMPMLGSEAKI